MSNQQSAISYQLSAKNLKGRGGLRPVCLYLLITHKNLATTEYWRSLRLGTDVDFSLGEAMEDWTDCTTSC